MAKIKVKEKEVRTEKRFVLTLNEKEAYVLLYILRQIGGSMDGPRGQCDSIRAALENNILRTDPLYRQVNALGNGGMRFESIGW